MTPPRRLPGVVTEDVPGTGECVLLDPARGRVLALNPAGAAVWDLLDGRRDLPHIAEVLAEAADIPLAQAQEDVGALLARLREEGFLLDDPPP